METTKRPMQGRITELDLSGPRPQVLVDGEVLAGVASALVEVNADSVPVLVLRIIRFDVDAATLPSGIDFRNTPQGG